VDSVSSLPTLTLVAASYVDGATLTLEFDRPINISAFVGDAVFVSDADYTGETWIATGVATLLSPTTMCVGLVDFEGSSGTGITLNAPDTTGIVAVDGGAAWDGVTDLALPFL
jgi:hypothetical protein